MHSFFRTLLFTFFAALFVLGAPAVVLYTAGYRYNPQNGHLVRTGALSVSSMPRGALVQWSPDDVGITTPYVYNRVMPGTYQLTISKSGYHTVTREVTVESGRSTYLSDIFLFLDAQPSLLLEDDADLAAPSRDGSALASLRRAKNAAEIWRYDIAGGTSTLVTQLTLRDDVVVELGWTYDGAIVVTNGEKTLYRSTEETAPAITFTDNGQAVEMHVNDTLLALLPTSTYTVAERDGSYVVVTDARDNLYFFDVSRADPILLSVRGSIFDWHHTLGRLAWSDGIELNSYDRNTSMFVTRQSTPIIGATWHNSGTAMLAATAEGLSALTFEHGIMQNSIPLADMAIDAFWADEEGRYAYLYGTYDGVRGLYRLRLK